MKIQIEMHMTLLHEHNSQRRFVLCFSFASYAIFALTLLLGVGIGQAYLREILPDDKIELASMLEVNPANENILGLTEFIWHDILD